MASKAPENAPAPETPVPKVCGVVMPISAIDGCLESHWIEVREIINDAIVQAGLKPNLVSESDDASVIQKTIVQNLYDNPIVVCDVSAKNPNVMFELGLRLAFDKPTVIIKDDCTSYSFDTSPIKHLEYPRDLRFGKIVDFKKRLAELVAGTLRSSETNTGGSPFLSSFGKFSVAKIETQEVSQIEFLLEEIKSLKAIALRLDGRSGGWVSGAIGGSVGHAQLWRDASQKLGDQHGAGEEIFVAPFFHAPAPRA
jgi:hypothetical protein